MSAPSPPEHFPAVFRIRVSLSAGWRLPGFVPFSPCGWRGEPRYTKAAALRQTDKYVEEAAEASVTTHCEAGEDIDDLDGQTARAAERSREAGAENVG
jgi:hypothetical protein